MTWYFLLNTVFLRKDVLNGPFIDCHEYSSFANQPGLHTIAIFFELRSWLYIILLKVLVDILSSSQNLCISVEDYLRYQIL